MKIVSFLPLAQVELDDAFVWYEDQAVGLGYEFLQELDQSIRLIASFPKLQPLVGNNIRRCLVNRFPYGIFFGISADRIIIVAVAHLRRKPAYWNKRIET